MVSRIEPWGFFIVMGLVIIGVVSTLWMTRYGVNAAADSNAADAIDVIAQLNAPAERHELPPATSLFS